MQFGSEDPPPPPPTLSTPAPGSTSSPPPPVPSPRRLPKKLLLLPLFLLVFIGGFGLAALILKLKTGSIPLPLLTTAPVQSSFPTQPPSSPTPLLHPLNLDGLRLAYPTEFMLDPAATDPAALLPTSYLTGSASTILGSLLHTSDPDTSLRVFKNSSDTSTCPYIRLPGDKLVIANETKSLNHLSFSFYTFSTTRVYHTLIGSDCYELIATSKSAQHFASLDQLLSSITFSSP